MFSHLSLDSHNRRLVSRLRKSTRVRDQAQLCSAVAAHLFIECEYQTAFTFYTFDEQLSVEAGLDAVDVLVPIRRQGECLCELGEYEDAVKQLQRCESVLQSLDSRTSAKRRNRLQQEVLICRGTALLNWSDDPQTPAHESRKRVLKAQQCYQRALSLAQQLCTAAKKGKRSRGDAEMLAGSYENLGTAVVQLLYFDNVELDNRRRQRDATTQNTNEIIDVTDSSGLPATTHSSSSPYDPLTSPPYSLEELSTDTLIAHKQSRFECASGLFDEAIAIAEECGLLEYSVRSLHNLGTLYEKMEHWDEAVSFLNTAILRIQDAAPRAVRMVDRIKHELSTRSVLVHMCTRAGRYELAVDEASMAVRRAKELDSGLDDARNDLKLAEDVAARMVAISTVEEHVAEREEAVKLEERRTASLSAIDLTNAADNEAGMKLELQATAVSVEAVVAAIPVLLSAVCELHKLSHLHVANATIGVRPMESFERALQAAEKSIDLQRAEAAKFVAAVKQQSASNSHESEDGLRTEQSFRQQHELPSLLSPTHRSAYNSLLDSLSHSYGHYGNTRLSLFRHTTMDKSDSSQLRRSRQLTLQAFEQAANTATTPLLRAYMMSRQAEVQFNSAVEHSVVMSTLRQALIETDKGGLVLLKERILQQMSSAIDAEEEVVLLTTAEEGAGHRQAASDKEQTSLERDEVTSRLQAVQRMKQEQRNGLGRELSIIRELDEKFTLTSVDDEVQKQASVEQIEDEKLEEVDVADEVTATAPSSRRSSRRQTAVSRQRPSVTRTARAILQAGRQPASSDARDSVPTANGSTVMLVSDDEEEEDAMDEGDDDDAYDPTFVDSHSHNTVDLISLRHTHSPARSASPILTPSGQDTRKTRSHRRLTASPPSSPPAVATHYDTDDSDAEDDQLGQRTAQVISALTDREERKEEVRMEGARQMRTPNRLQSHSPAGRQQNTRKRQRRTSRSEAVRVAEADIGFIVDDEHDRFKVRETRSSAPRAPLLFSSVPSRRSMRDMNASGQSWRAVCAQLLADRERSRADEHSMVQSQSLPMRGTSNTGSRQSSDDSSGGRERTGSTGNGSRSSQLSAHAQFGAHAAATATNRVEHDLAMLDAETETVTTRTETQYVGDSDIHYEPSPPSQPQSQSLPLTVRPANGHARPTYSDPVVAYRPLHSNSAPRHSIRYEVEDLAEAMPLVAGADDRSQSLTDEELSGISMLALADELLLHIQRRTGRVCVIGSISHRGELLGADHNALHIFQRHQQSGTHSSELPLLSIELDRWKAVTVLDCYRTLCQTSSSNRIHPLVLQQVHSSATTTIAFPQFPPPTLNSTTLVPLFHALRVEPGHLTSLRLPGAVLVEADAAAALARSICYSQAPFLPLTTRLAYSELFPHAVFPLMPQDQHQEPLPRPFTRLSQVSLAGAKVTSAYMTELLASFALLPALTELDLSDTLLQDEALPGVRFLLRHSASIIRFNLSRSFFTGSTIIARVDLGAAFTASETLTHIDLSYSHLSLASASSLLPMLVRLNHLNLSSLRCLYPYARAPASSLASDRDVALTSFYSSLYSLLSSPLCCLTAVVLHDVADVRGQLGAVMCLALAAPSCRLQCVELCDNGLSVPGVLRLLAVLRRRNATVRRLVLDGNRAVGHATVQTQLLDWMDDMWIEVARQVGPAERMQCNLLGELGGPDKWCMSRLLRELSVRRCGLSLVAQKQLLAQASHVSEFLLKV